MRTTMKKPRLSALSKKVGDTPAALPYVVLQQSKAKAKITQAQTAAKASSSASSCRLDRPIGRSGQSQILSVAIVVL